MRLAPLASPSLHLAVFSHNLAKPRPVRKPWFCLLGTRKSAYHTVALIKAHTEALIKARNYDFQIGRGLDAAPAGVQHLSLLRDR